MATAVLDSNPLAAPAGGPRRAIMRVAGWAPTVVGLIFLYYGAGKAWELATTALSLNYLLHNLLLSKYVAIAVASTDVYLATLLLLAKNKRGPVIATLCCLTAYSCFLGYLMSMQNPPNCGCGGMMKFFISNRMNAGAGLVRNIALISYLGTYYYFHRKLKPGRG